MAAPTTTFVRTRAASSISVLQRVLICLGLLTAAALAAQVVTALSARHELSQVESIVAIHAGMLSRGDGIYYDLQHYPFTVSPYGPVFYSLSALLQTGGVAPLVAGRLISVLALSVSFALCYRLAWRYTADHAASLTATLLLASTANILQWGTTGQVDTLALCFSLAALLAYSRHEFDGRMMPLLESGTWILLAVFTKQSFAAAAAAIVWMLLLTRPRRAVCFAGALSLTAAALAFTLNHVTHGRFFDNAVLANLNPYRFHKLEQHLAYFLPTAGSLIAIALAGGFRRANGHVFAVYGCTSAAVLLLTAPKVGSDLNYQIEAVTALCLMAGWVLHRLAFFTLWQRRDCGWVTLLQLPLLLHFVLNLSLTAKTVVERRMIELLRRQEAAVFQPYFAASDKRILSVQIDPLLQNRRSLEVEPLIYTLLVNAGVVNPEPVTADLTNRRFDLVVLYEDVFTLPEQPKDPEMPSLPESQLEQIRRNYRLVRHIPGALLDGDYLYEPIAP